MLLLVDVVSHQRRIESLPRLVLGAVGTGAATFAVAPDAGLFFFVQWDVFQQFKAPYLGKLFWQLFFGVGIACGGTRNQLMQWE